jgi:hypothetical protein
MDREEHSENRKYFTKSIYRESLSNVIENNNYFIIFFNIFSCIIHFLSKFSILEFTNENIPFDEKHMSFRFFNFIFLISTISLGFASNKIKSSKLLTIYLISLIIMNLNIAFGYSTIFDLSIFNLKLGIIDTLLHIIFLTLSFSISICLIFEFLYSLGYKIFHSDHLTFDHLISETKFKLDLIKIRINSLIVLLGLHKFLPFILFKKTDFYFMSDTSNEQDKSLYSKKFKSPDNEEEFINSLSTINSETELLKSM